MSQLDWTKKTFPSWTTTKSHRIFVYVSYATRKSCSNSSPRVTSVKTQPCFEKHNGRARCNLNHHESQVVILYLGKRKRGWFLFPKKPELRTTTTTTDFALDWKCVQTGVVCFTFRAHIREPAEVLSVMTNNLRQSHLNRIQSKLPIKRAGLCDTQSSCTWRCLEQTLLMT